MSVSGEGLKKKETLGFLDGTALEESKLQEYIKGDVPIKFDWENKWLKGEEYAHILQHMEAYCRVFSLQKYSQKQHPDSIYIEPQSKICAFSN